MTQLLIAAGGGGDVIGTTLVHHALHGGELARRTRLFVGAAGRGPDSRSAFRTGLHRSAAAHPAPLADHGGLGHHRPGGFHSAPPGRRAADHAGAAEPVRGVPQLARQIAEAAEKYAVDEVAVVDVGGDVFARGDEPTLLSPLPDALVIAACVAAGVPAHLHLAGPGLDCEIPEQDLLPDLGTDWLTLTEADTRGVAHLFDWHPTEASALLAAAARGRRGGCFVRDTGRPVVLSDASARVYRIPLDRVLARNRLAHELYTRLTATLDEAEQASWNVCGFSELRREREQSLLLQERNSPDSSVDDAWLGLDAWLEQLQNANSQARYATFRCLAEGLGLTGEAALSLRARLIEQRPHRYATPLFALR
ncbi:DUF1152 domain-containing protein [Streptomyces lasalocidi]